MNRTGQSIANIVIHCSAGYGDLASMRRFWRSMGWRSDGYHRLVDLDGSILEVTPFNLPSNGVAGYNANSIHICYRGGVLRENTTKAADSRTPEQKTGLKVAINEALRWIDQNGGDVSKIRIKGHRDFSPDKDGNGVIASWERIKECPSFDAIPEYSHMVSDYLVKKGINTAASMEYTVRAGDTLYSIARLYSGITADNIGKLNSIKNGSIKVGQRLKIK